MALIKCPECGKEISDRSESCINCGFPLKVENHSNKSLRRQPKYLNTSCKQKPSGTVLMVLVIALLLITGIIFVSVAFAFKNKNKEDISVKSDTTSTSEPSDFLQQEDEGLPLYLGMLGTETTDGHMDVSQNFIDNLQNVVIMKKAGSVSHKYVESGESAGLINKMSWVSNDTYTQDEFDAFIESMDLFFDYYGARDKDIDKSDKTYIWIDVLHSSRVLGWYADEKINLCWEWDERIASNPHSDSKDSYAGIPDDLMDSEMRRF